MSDVDPFEPSAVRAAVGRSVLGGLKPALADAVVAEAIRTEVSAGRRYVEAPLSLVVTGLIRVGISSPDGRGLTVSYLRSGDVMGLARLVGRRFPLDFQAVTDCRFLRLSPTRFEELRRSQPAVAAAVSAQLVRHIDDILNELTLAAFGNVRQRSVRHLLTLADGSHPDGKAACRITHQQLADAVGAARETVTHRLSELRAEGLIEEDRARHLVVISDPGRLRADLFDTGTGTTDDRDQPHIGEHRGHSGGDGPH